MRTIAITMIVAVAVLFTADARPLKKQTIEFHVDGTCNMCKNRIETGLDVNGVRFVEWNPKTEQCTVVFNDKKITEMEIHQKIAALGHNTDKVKASDSAYQSLPGCCKYDDGVHSH